MSKGMKVYHIHFKGGDQEPLNETLTEGRTLQYFPMALHDDLKLHWNEVLQYHHFDGFIAYEISVPDTYVTTDIDDIGGSKVLKITNKNARKFARRYPTTYTLGNKQLAAKLQTDFAGVDASDPIIHRTVAEQSVRNGSQSGAIWRFNNVQIKTIEEFSP